MRRKTEDVCRRMPQEGAMKKKERIGGRGGVTKREDRDDIRRSTKRLC